MSTHAEAAALPRYPRVAVTGHRPHDFTEPQQRWVRATLTQVLDRLRLEHGAEVALSGLSRGADTWWAQAATQAGATLWAYIPFDGQADRWPAGDRAEWTRLRSMAAREVVVGTAYSARHFHARNDLLVRDCDLMLAVHQPTRTTGGTATTIRKARAAGRPMIRIDPSERRISFVAGQGAPGR